MQTAALIDKATTLGLTDAIATYQSGGMSKCDLESCVAHVLEGTYRKRAHASMLAEVSTAAMLGASPQEALFRSFSMTRNKIRIGR